MSRGKAITLAVFTVWPFLYMLLFMCTMFGMMISDFSGGNHSSGPPVIMMIIIPLHFLTMLEIFGLLVIYIVHVFKTDRVPQDQKALWAVVLFLGNMIAMPIYLYLYIWKKQEIKTPDQTSPHSEPIDIKMKKETNEATKSLTNKEISNIVSDTIVGYNSRKSDNRLQVKITFSVMFVCACIGGFFYGADWFLFGGFFGLFFGIIISGIYLMIFRAIKHAQGNHE